MILFTSVDARVYALRTSLRFIRRLLLLFFILEKNKMKLKSFILRLISSHLVSCRAVSLFSLSMNATNTKSKSENFVAVHFLI